MKKVDYFLDLLLQKFNPVIKLVTVKITKIELTSNPSGTIDTYFKCKYICSKTWRKSDNVSYTAKCNAYFVLIDYTYFD